LNGADFDGKLVSTTSDGIRIYPVYGQRAGPRAERQRLAPWMLHQRIDHPDAGRANAQIRDDIANGATGLTLVFQGHRASRGFGIAIENLAGVLEGIPLHAVALRLEGGAAAALADIIERQPIDPERLDLSCGLDDPAHVKVLTARGFRGPFLEVDGRALHEQGATEAQELGAVLALAARHLDSVEPPAIAATLAASQDMFVTLAKFRAMRLLWARLLELGGFAPAPLRLHGETSFRMLAKLDPHTNILRSSAAVFGAGLGGADSICVLPFSLAQGLPNAFARRVARNVQTVLLEEADLWRIADPASGAGYVEHLTEALCERAWDVFRKARAGDWRRPDPGNPYGLPVIGTTAHRLDSEFAAEVESAA
jgi:methylmalonyl-CoA mutase